METLYGFECREPDRRRVPTGQRAWEIKSLWQRSHEIVGLSLQGHSNEAIAKILGITPQTVSNTLNSQLGKEKVSNMRQERDEEYIKLNEKITSLSKKAIAVYEDIFENDTASLALKKKVADTVLLDLAGHRAPTKIESRNSHLHLTGEELLELKERGKAAAKAAGLIVQVDA